MIRKNSITNSNSKINTNTNTNASNSSKNDPNSNKMTARNTDDRIGSSSSSSSSNKNNNNAKENSNTTSSGTNDDTVFEGIVQLINQVNKQVQEKSNLQGKLRGMDELIKSINENISNAKLDAISFDEERQRLIVDCEGIETKIAKAQSTLDDERNSKSQLSLSSKNILEKTSLLTASNTALKAKFESKMEQMSKKSDANRNMINSITSNSEIMAILKHSLYPHSDNISEMTITPSDTNVH